MITLGECRVLSLLSFCGNQEGTQTTFMSWRILAKVSDHGRYLLNVRVTLTVHMYVAVNVANSVRFGARGAPQKIPAPHRTAGRGGGSFFFRPAPCPVFASPRKVPVPGPRFLRGTVRGPANCSQFRAGDAYFRRMLSNKHTPDRQGWRIFTIRRLLSTGNEDHRRILGSKNTPDPQS